MPRARAEGASVPGGQAASGPARQQPGHAQTLEEVHQPQLQRREQAAGAAALALHLHHGRGAAVAGPGPARPPGVALPRGAHQASQPAQDCPALDHSPLCLLPRVTECQAGPV